MVDLVDWMVMVTLAGLQGYLGLVGVLGFSRSPDGFVQTLKLKDTAG